MPKKEKPPAAKPALKKKVRKKPRKKTSKKKPRKKGKKLVSSKKKIYSPRQIIAVKKLSEIIRNSKKRKGVTLGKILRESGYSESFSKRPGDVIKSKSFQELLEHHLPDKLITKAHGGALRAMVLDHYTFPKTEDDKKIKKIVESVPGCKFYKISECENWKRAYFHTVDNKSRLKAIAEAYKVKSKYPAERHEVEARIAVVEVVNYGSRKED